MSNQTFSKFTKEYQTQRTLRFSLLPMGKTEEHIHRDGLINADKVLADKYKQAKQVIDEYHKDFIDECLQGFTFDINDLKDIEKQYLAIKKLKSGNENKSKLNKELIKTQNKLCKKVGDFFTKSSKWDHLFKKELITKDIPAWLEGRSLPTDEEFNANDIINDFKKWTTYFKGFHENRKNIYTSKPISTAIGYRLVYENLPIFIDNIQSYNKATELGVDFSDIEKNLGIELKEVFSLSYFKTCLTQEGIDFYNLVRGGRTESVEEKKQGINEIINLSAQQINSKNVSDEEKKILEKRRKNIRSCTTKKLHKQILSDRSEISFRFVEIKSDSQLCDTIEASFRVNTDKNLIGTQEIEDKETKEISSIDYNISQHLKQVLPHINTYNASKLYIKNGRGLTDISQYLFGNWSLIKRSLEYYAEKSLYPKKGKKDIKKDIINREKWVNDTLYFSFEEIHTALELFFSVNEVVDEDDTHSSKETYKKEGLTIEMKKKALSHPLFEYFSGLKMLDREGNEEHEVDIYEEIRKSYDAAIEVLETYSQEKEEKLKSKEEEVEKLKRYLDAIKKLQNFLSPLYVEYRMKKGEQRDILEKDMDFYFDFDACYEILARIIPLYNQARNYLTKKPFNVEKYKLNFSDSTLADGWDRNKETDNLCVLLLKDEQFFLGIMNKKTNKIFTKEYTDIVEIHTIVKEKKKTLHEEELKRDGKKQGTSTYEKLSKKIEDITKEIACYKKRMSILQSESNVYRKVNYKLLPGPDKMLPKVFFSDKNIKEYSPSEKIITIRNHSSHTKGGKPQKNYEKRDFDVKDMRAMVDFYKQSINKHPEWVDFNFQFTPTSQYEDSSKFYGEVASQGYQITFQDIPEDYINQCVDEGSLYLFQIYNKDFSSYSKGRPNLHTMYWKMLFDENNLKDVVYKLNGEAELFFRKKSIDDNDKFVHPAKEPINNKNEENEKKKSVFAYDIIKDKRYTKNTYLFHVPITSNFKEPSLVPQFNNHINRFLKNNPHINILSIDRGERYLTYYTLLNQKGEILTDKEGSYVQGSWDKMKTEHKGNTYTKNYRDMLDAREKERDDARKSWETIDNIKDLKAGYLSRVVHEICKLAIEYNAIIVLEDLNFGFKRGRFKVEKQIYQKLEKMLIDKLNYLVFKDKDLTSPGGVLNAYQLAHPFESFQKMGKQTGIIFYVPAYHTSKVCPATGFVNLLYPRYETKQKAQEFFSKFEKICWNSKQRYFEFHITEYGEFNDKASSSRQEWVVCTYKNRLENFRNKSGHWDTREVNISEDMKKILDSEGIVYADGVCIKDDIIAIDDSSFFKKLIKILRLTLQMRNSRSGSDEDWMISPVQDEQGEFFDSRTAEENKPQNADANGAFHIGLKGIWVLRQIDKVDWGEKNPELDIAIKNEDWYKFIQDKEYKR